MLYRNFVAALEITQATFWRGARVVMEQFAKLSTGNRRRGSNPRLSAKYEKNQRNPLVFFMPRV
jgi:hypothetical protein